MRSQFFVGILAFIICLSSNSCMGQMSDAEYTRLRVKMVEQQLIGRGIHNKGVLEVFRKVPRHLFVPLEIRNRAYDDCPLPIGYNQTISQPFIVAYMTEILNPNKNMKVLEIGTGSGYQAAILAELCKEVYTIEIVVPLANQARELFTKKSYTNIKAKTADGYQGWTEYAPFDAILVTCAPTNIPAPLIEQLAEGGKMIIPAGDRYNQTLYLVEKRNGKIIQTETLPVLFVPMLRDD